MPPKRDTPAKGERELIPSSSSKRQRRDSAGGSSGGAASPRTASPVPFLTPHVQTRFASLSVALATPATPHAKGNPTIGRICLIIDLDGTLVHSAARISPSLSAAEQAAVESTFPFDLIRVPLVAPPYLGPPAAVPPSPAHAPDAPVGLLARLQQHQQQRQQHQRGVQPAPQPDDKSIGAPSGAEAPAPAARAARGAAERPLSAAGCSFSALGAPRRGEQQVRLVAPPAAPASAPAVVLVKIRPFARELLAALAPHATLWVFTLSRRHYAEAVVRALDPTEKLFGAPGDSWRLLAAEDCCAATEDDQPPLKSLEALLRCPAARREALTDGDGGPLAALEALRQRAIIVDDRLDAWVAGDRKKILQCAAYEFFDRARAGGAITPAALESMQEEVPQALPELPQLLPRLLEKLGADVALRPAATSVSSSKAFTSTHSTH
jgi:hypothetical protein